MTYSKGKYCVIEVLFHFYVCVCVHLCVLDCEEKLFFRQVVDKKKFENHLYNAGGTFLSNIQTHEEM